MTRAPASGGETGGDRDSAPKRDFIARLETSLADGSFVRLVLSSPAAATKPVDRVFARVITLGEKPALSVTIREKTRDLTRNLPLAGVAQWFSSEFPQRFAAALLETTSCDWQLALGSRGQPRLIPHRARSRVAPDRGHDRSRIRSLQDSAHDWLQALGLVDASGRILPSRADKHQQVMRYAELLGHLARECDWQPGTRVSVADMGCGRGSLTFAAWQMLRRQLGLDAHVTGIETRAELVHEAESTARRLGLEGLGFAQGEIATHPLGALDVLIALHACNTATDDAILRGVKHRARLLLVAPCCHQEIRPQLGRPAPFDALLRHGLLAERFAEWLTDGLRVLFLEWAGYRVRAIEFVASEHTPRNVLIAGVSTGRSFQDSTVRERIVALKKLYGIRRHALDSLLS